MNQLIHFMQSRIRKVHPCLAVACHLHFWQNDRDLLRATAVTRGWNEYRNKFSTESRPGRRKFSRRSCRVSNPRPFDHESGALTTELSPLPSNNDDLVRRRQESDLMMRIIMMMEETKAPTLRLKALSKYVNWCFTPSQPVRLYQSDRIKTLNIANIANT